GRPTRLVSDWSSDGCSSDLGQPYIPLEAKIGAVRALIDGTGRAIDLEVDGGIPPATAPHAVAAGADVLVAGSAIFGGGPATYARSEERRVGKEWGAAGAPRR